MKKQQKQLLVAAICAVVLIIAYFGVKSYNAQQEEAEAAQTAGGVLGDGNTADTAEYGFDAPVNVITFTTAAGKTTLTLGMENPVTGQYYLQKDGGGEIYLIPSTLEAGFSTTLDEMVKAE